MSIMYTQFILIDFAGDIRAMIIEGPIKMMIPATMAPAFINNRLINERLTGTLDT